MTQNALSITRFDDLPQSIAALASNARGEGFWFVDRLVAEWEVGINRFDQPGEIFVGAFQAGELVAICGLNRDPYADQPGIARLRHLYVLQRVRRNGIASGLVNQLVTQALSVFHTVRLRTGTQDAAARMLPPFTPGLASSLLMQKKRRISRCYKSGRCPEINSSHVAPLSYALHGSIGRVGSISGVEISFGRDPGVRGSTKQYQPLPLNDKACPSRIRPLSGYERERGRSLQHSNLPDYRR